MKSPTDPLAASFCLVVFVCLMLADARASGAEAKPKIPWTSLVGKISLTDLNSNCDIVLTGKVERSTNVSAKPPVTEIHVTKILAARGGLEGEFESVITNSSGSKIIILLGVEAQVRKRWDVVLLSGGEYLFWLTKKTNGIGSVTLPAGWEKSRPSFFEPTDNWRSVYCISDPEFLRIIHSMPMKPYEWQSELLAECVGTNDINKFLSLSYQLARALRPKADPVSELTVLTHVKSNPALAKIASQHLARGVTNGFSYVNLRFLDRTPQSVR